MISKLQLSRLPGMILMPVVVSLMISCFTLIQISCRPLDEQRTKVDVSAPPSPSQLVDSLIQSGNDLRRLDVLDLEGTASISSSQRERMRTKILEVASGHSRKYRDHLYQLARFPQQRVDDEINASLAANRKISKLPDIVKVIELHLRLARADTPPTESRIIWDFGNLRYAHPSLR